MSTAASSYPPRQLSFPELCPVSDALKHLAAAGIEERGAIFTRREVVDFILDITGYTEDRRLHDRVQAWRMEPIQNSMT